MSGSLRILVGDIASQHVDAIVNAANERMLGGAGVDGAIHAAAGPRLVKACRAVPEIRPDVRCPTGQARITPGFDLPANFVIHTVGPIYQGIADDARLLRSAYTSSLSLALEHNLRTIAFPAISCGAYGFPMKEAAEIALTTARAPRWSRLDIRFVLWTDAAYRIWTQCFDALSEVDDG